MQQHARVARLFATTSVIVACLPATAAWAEGPYAGVEGGVYRQQSLRYDFVTLDDLFVSNYTDGYDIAIKGGWDFEGVRVEGEIGYKRARVRQFGFSIDGEEFLVQDGPEVTGKVKTLSGMINVYWDITQGPVRPFVGAGAGVAHINSDGVGYAGYGENGIFLDAKDTALAFQVMAGTAVKINDHVSAHIKYRYFDVEDVNLGVFNSFASSKLRSSSIVAGVTVFFAGQKRRPPPPPLPVPLPPPPPPPPPVPTSYEVQFDHLRAGTSAEIDITLDKVAAAYHQMGYASVIITSDADISGPTVYNDSIALKRGAVIKQGLVARGVPEDVITVENFVVAPVNGETRESRERVYIGFGPGSGQ